MNYDFSDKVKDMQPSAIREIFKFLSDPNMISLAAGNPSAASFPIEKIRAISEQIFLTCPVDALQYSVTEGYAPLRAQVAQRLKERFSIGTDSDDVIITTGGQQGIDLTAKVLCNEGDTVICENPSFIGALNAFRSYNTKLVGVDVEPDGINVEMLEKALRENPRTKLIYLIPTFQNPSGVTMSYEKRRAVMALAEKYNTVILEDNPYGELRFDGEDVPTLKSMDTNGRVLYCSSFSKILSAGMRVGFVCGNRELIQKIVVVKQVNDVHTNIFFQMLASKFIEIYGLDEHIASIRALYRAKSSLMIGELEKNFGDTLTFVRPQGGLFIWCTLPEGYDSALFTRRALENMVAVVAGNTFSPDKDAVSRSFRLNYSTPSDEQIIEGVARLKKTFDSIG
ncbi:MAG: PLP-dependent aminotransferase family protein [Clostridiales bacterium]|nr:MAG: PLP-dependent aminotransferase family protein [Clostridiales bacterium]